MRRALVWLNLYSCEAVQQKLKNTLKTPKMHFLPVFELMSDSLTATKVETNQCPSHQSIILTQGPIQQVFTKNIENWRSLKRLAFLVKGQVFALRFDVRSNRVKKISCVPLSTFLSAIIWTEVWSCHQICQSWKISCSWQPIPNYQQTNFQTKSSNNFSSHNNTG